MSVSSWISSCCVSSFSRLFSSLSSDGCYCITVQAGNPSLWSSAAIMQRVQRLIGFQWLYVNLSCFKKTWEQDTKTNHCFPFSGNATWFITGVGPEPANTHYETQTGFLSTKNMSVYLKCHLSHSLNNPWATLNHSAPAGWRLTDWIYSHYKSSNLKQWPHGRPSPHTSIFMDTVTNKACGVGEVRLEFNIKKKNWDKINDGSFTQQFIMIIKFKFCWMPCIYDKNKLGETVENK